MTERRSGFRALVVEDDAQILGLVKTVLARENFTVEGVTNGRAAIELMRTVAYDLLIIDLMLPEVSGEEVLGYLEEEKPRWLRRVIVTTASPRSLSCEFLHKVCRLLEKPFDIDKLILWARECAKSDPAEGESVA
jgi:two-component system OmpR family response regulator